MPKKKKVTEAFLRLTPTPPPPPLNLDGRMDRQTYMPFDMPFGKAGAKK